MAEKGKRKTGGGKLSRSETVTVRLDPKQRYLAELAARKQRRTLSSFIEWAIDQALSKVYLDDDVSIADVSGQLWDVDEPDRFANLALRYEHLLTHEEQVLWKLICLNGYLWRGRFNSDDMWTWRISPSDLLFDRLREYWNVFVYVAKGEFEKDVLPTWTITRSKKTDDFDDIKDDIPF